MWNSQVDIMLHQSHAGITGPALLVVITHYVLIVGVWVLRQVPLNQIPGLVGREPGGPMKKPQFTISNLNSKNLLFHKSVLFGRQGGILIHRL